MPIGLTAAAVGGAGVLLYSWNRMKTDRERERALSTSPAAAFADAPLPRDIPTLKPSPSLSAQPEMNAPLRRNANVGGPFASHEMHPHLFASRPRPRASMRHPVLSDEFEELVLEDWDNSI
jgi:hypothetical protein